jgi:hypothetical protein
MTIADVNFGFGNMQLKNVNVETSPLPSGPFIFPEYFAQFNGPSFFGDSNICDWDATGFCLSEGAFPTFTGTFDGSLLTMNGGQPLDFNFLNGYFYEIHASLVQGDGVLPVPEPGSALLLLFGLAALQLRRARMR